jgi:hypothetical protein
MSKFYLISLNCSDDERLENFIKETFENWAHYLKCTWFVVSNMNVKEITDKLSPWIRSSDERQLLLVSEVNPADINGWLPHGAWQWFAKNQQKIMFSEMESPSLVDMYNCGIFDPELITANSITDIDNILKPYENQVTGFALETVRGRMIERISAIARSRYEAG